MTTVVDDIEMNNNCITSIGYATFDVVEDMIALSINAESSGRTTNLAVVALDTTNYAVVIDSVGNTQIYKRLKIYGANVSSADIYLQQSQGQSSDLMQFVTTASGLVSRFTCSGMLLMPPGTHLSGAVNVHQLNLAVSGVSAAAGVTTTQMNLAISGHTDSLDDHILRYIHKEPATLSRNLIVPDSSAHGIKISTSFPLMAVSPFVIHDTDGATDVVTINADRRFIVAGVVSAIGLNASGNRVTNVSGALAMTDAPAYYQVMAAVSGHSDLTAAHGATGAVVGTTNTQTLSNKTLLTPIISGASAISTKITSLANATAMSDAVAFNQVMAVVSGHSDLTAAHGATGAVVGTTNTQTLTNKTLTTPIISGGVGLYWEQTFYGVDLNSAVTTLTMLEDGLSTTLYYHPIVRNCRVARIAASVIHAHGSDPGDWDLQFQMNGVQMGTFNMPLSSSSLSNQITTGTPSKAIILSGGYGLSLSASGISVNAIIVKTTIGFETL